MARKYDPSDERDLQSLNKICSVYGIHFEKDLFERTYVVVDHAAFFPERQKYAKREQSHKNVQN